MVTGTVNKNYDIFFIIKNNFNTRPALSCMGNKIFEWSLAVQSQMKNVEKILDVFEPNIASAGDDIFY